MLKVVATIVLVGLVQQALLAPSLDSFLLKTLNEKGTANVFVNMREQTSGVLKNLVNTNFETRADRLNAVTNELKAFTAKSQASTLQLLEQESQNKPYSFESLWITNQIYIRNADLSIVEKLSALPEVQSVTEEKFVHLDEPLDLTVHDNLPAAEDDEFQWGVEQIEAPQVWNSGNEGQGVVVATIDTGVRGTHETLRDNHRKAYGWFDPGRGTAEPNDQNGHGTHTTANIAGKLRGVGVARGAQWIACKGCASSSCSQSDLTRCGQFIACPTDTDGNNPDCSQAPDVVSNSWGGGRGNTWYRPVIDTWRAANIFPLFSIGNSGPNCNTANSPGDEDNVIGVGSTTIDNIVSYFSSVGPTLIGTRMKPDISAPGSNVFSAYYTSDTAYATMSGTSMACPHAAGTVALMISSSPNAKINYDIIKQALEGGSVRTTGEGKTCSGVGDNQFPNHHVGHGRINARQSVVRLQQLLRK